MQFYRLPRHKTGSFFGAAKCASISRGQGLDALLPGAHNLQPASQVSTQRVQGLDELLPGAHNLQPASQISTQRGQGLDALLPGTQNVKLASQGLSSQDLMSQISLEVFKVNVEFIFSIN